jgi:hypothetical protein
MSTLSKVSIVPDGYRVEVVERDGDPDYDTLVRIYKGTRCIVTATTAHLAAFFCWLSAERDALLAEVEGLRAFKAGVDAALNSGDGSYGP